MAGLAAVAIAIASAAGAGDIGETLASPAGDDASIGELVAGDGAGGVAESFPAACGPGCDCGAGVRHGGEDWWLFDVVFLQRDNQATYQVFASVAGDAIITSGQPQYLTVPGVRLFRGQVNDCGRGWEVGYLGVWNMTADLERGGDGNVQANDPLALLVDGFLDRSLASMTSVSTLNSAEASLLFRRHEGGYRRCSPYPWERCHTYRRGSLDWLAGFRWAGLDERAGLEFSGGDFPGPSRYDVRTTSNFYAVQVGGRGRMEWDRWGLDGWVKLALAGVATSQSQAAIGSVFVPDPPVRPATAATSGSAGFIGDINLGVSYRIADAWRLRAGYNFLWLTGVALAANQFDFGSSATAGTGLVGGAGVYLHGANLGLETAW